MATTRAPNRRRRWFPLLVAVAVAVVGLALFANRLYEGSPRSWPREPFSEKAWAASPRGERFRLMKDLDGRNLLAGLSEQQVVALLGHPDYKSPDARYLQYTLKEWTRPGPMRNALFMLQVDLDSVGRVTAYSVRHE